MLDTATDTFLDDLAEGVRMVPFLPRVRFEADLSDVAQRWIRKKHAAGAVHEPATLAAFIAAQKRAPLKHVFDVGALFGYFSLFAMNFFEGVEVTAFEMHPGIIPDLHKNVSPYAKIVHGVITDEVRERVRFWVSGFNIFEEPAGGWDELVNIPGAMKPRGANNRGRGFAKVPFTTLDAWCADNPAPDLLKIDVEGYQAKALKGGMGMIAAHKPVIVIELHDPEKLERFGVTNAQTVQPLFDLGYRAYWCPNFRGADARYEPVTVMGPEHERLCIMVFVP